MNIKDEVYTLEQLRKMNCLDGDKKLVFLTQVNKYIDDRERIHQINLKCAREGTLQRVGEIINKFINIKGRTLTHHEIFYLARKDKFNVSQSNAIVGYVGYYLKKLKKELKR